MQYFPVILLIVAGLILVIRPLTVLIHEMGHALPALLLTRQKVTVYLGSYGDPDKSIRFRLGLLEIYFRYNPFAWNSGLCVPSAEEISINKKILYVISGPIASLFLGIIACYFTFGYDLHGFLKLFFIIFLGSAAFDLLSNLIPDSKPIPLFKGEFAYNDGFTLKQLFYYKGLPKEFSRGIDLYDKQKFAEAAIIFEKVVTEVEDETLYRYTINTHLHAKNYKRVIELSEKLASCSTMDTQDWSSLALANAQTGLLDESLELYDKSLALDPKDPFTLNNKGYTLNKMNRFKEAIILFDRSIEINKDFAYSYNNRGLAKIKLGKKEEGLQDINYSFELDPNNSYGYRNLGIFHFEEGNYKEALTLFEKSREIDKDTDMIDEFILNTRSRLENISLS